MANSSQIEWTEATWNPSTGCTKISQGCKNCYAETLSKRLKAMKVRKYRNNFKFTQHEDEIDLPLKWSKPRKIFVNSMSDLFHKNAETEFIRKCFFTMTTADWHTYQVLTKRPNRMIEFSKMFREYFGYSIPDHIWMGTSVENKETAWRINELRRVKCSTRFVSFEPLLGDIKRVNMKNIDWAIIGGESGHHYREVKESWIQNLIKECKRQNVKVFFKQWGGIRPKANGRTINGKTYDEYPVLKKPKSARIRQAAKIRITSQRGKIFSQMQDMPHSVSHARSPKPQP